MPRSQRLLLVALAALPSLLWAATTLPHTFSNGTVASAAQVNANFSALATAIDTPAAGSVFTTVAYTNQTQYRTSATAWQVGPTFTYAKQRASSDLLINAALPFYITPGDSGFGVKLQYSLNNTTWLDADLAEGPAHGWGSGGYGGNASGVLPYLNLLSVNATGTVYFRFAYRVWVATEDLYFIGYTGYPKRAVWTVQEVAR